MVKLRQDTWEDTFNEKPTEISEGIVELTETPSAGLSRDVNLLPIQAT